MIELNNYVPQIINYARNVGKRQDKPKNDFVLYRTLHKVTLVRKSVILVP